MNKIKVLKFSSEWCPPCKLLKKVWDEIEPKYKNTTDIELVSLDIDEDDETTSKFSIRSIPTIVFLKNDVEQLRLNLFQQKSVIESKIQELL